MIVKAAVNAEGRIYTGHRHGEAIHNAVEAGEPTPITQKMQGFVTDTGKWLTRREAREHAVACGQIPFDKNLKGQLIISEDLW